MAESLLPAHRDRLPWRHKIGAIRTQDALKGPASTALSVVAGTAPSRPTVTDLRAVWARYAGHRDEPTLVAVHYPGPNESTRFALHGPTDEAPPVFDLTPTTTTTLLEWALAERSFTTLIRDLTLKLQSLSTGDPRPRNEGLFTAHVLNIQPERTQFADYTLQGNKMLPKRGTDLLHDLGYIIEDLPGRHASVLLADNDHKAPRRALAVLLRDGESIESPIGRFGSATAVSYGRDIAIREGLAWLVILASPKMRLYPTDPDLGVGRKGVTQTYVELDLDLLDADSAGYLPLLFSADSLAAAGAVQALLDESARHAVGLADRLRDRIYEDIIPSLSEAIAYANGIEDTDPDDQQDVLRESYHQSMIILFRLLFVAYAEDRGLLPYGRNAAYTDASMEGLAEVLLKDPDAYSDDESTYLWQRITGLWQVIDNGNTGMGVPAYDGGLFTADPEKNYSGAEVYNLALTDAAASKILSALLIDTDEQGDRGLVDFRSLDVREFGTIYEGLLESGLNIAATDLTVDSSDTYVPVRKKSDEVWVEEGQVYFHSRTGTRKATGSYFTKPFAVQHLLNTALEPALDAHLEQVRALIDAGRDQAAGDLLWDFRVADLSMGSAHFLVSAIDRVEDRFSRFLATHPLPTVKAELDTLRTAAKDRSGPSMADEDVDDASVMRRVIARRVIYGLDINEIAVELARLAVWIHTFVPGLPLSFLDHNLVWGNSLTGVGTLDEVATAIEEAEQRELGKAAGQASLGLTAPLEDLLARANRTLAALAKVAETTPTEVSQAHAYQQQLKFDLEPLTALCDLITAERTTRTLNNGNADASKIRLTDLPNLAVAVTGRELEASVLAHPALGRAREIAREVQAAHMPVLFPEVFNRGNAGFDVILGNPPWEELVYEEIKFWTLRFPGFRSLSPTEQTRQLKRYRSQFPALVDDMNREMAEAEAMRHVLMAGPFPGMGSGHADLYKAFAGRFLHTLRVGGRCGVVLPRGALSAAGSGEWRHSVLTRGGFSDVTLITNTGNWAFDEIHPQYTFALVAMERSGDPVDLRLSGPFRSKAEFDEHFRSAGDAASISHSEVLSWPSSSAFPLLPDGDSVSVFQRMREHPRLDEEGDEWSFRCLQGDFNQTTDRALWIHDGTPGDLAVYKGSSFYLWDPDASDWFATAKASKVVPALMARRRRQSRRTSGAYSGLPESVLSDRHTLSLYHPRIAFRDITNQTNTRTVIACLVPGNTILTNKAPFLVRRAGSAKTEAYLLGVLSSIPLDWYARRYVEISLNFHILNAFPIPRPLADSPLQPRIIEIAGRLAAVDDRFADWADEVGVPVGSVTTEAQKSALIHELDALVALIYGLTKEQVTKVFTSFHRGWDYRPRLDDVQAYYRVWLDQIGGAL